MLVRTPTDWTNSRIFILVLVLGQVLQAWLASFRSLREREFYQAWQASPLPETVRTGNLKLQPTTIPDHTLHDMTCRPVFCTAVQSSSSSTTCDFYSCISIRLLRWHIRSRTSHVLDRRKVNYSVYPTNVDVYRPGRASRRPTRGNFGMLVRGKTPSLMVGHGSVRHSPNLEGACGTCTSLSLSLSKKKMYVLCAVL